ncbi:hypothetical protein E4U55_007060 [Claviceps digitariae]|nr:hypothetical protein E4U55_007060 [Claviceps digitariae]
MVHQMLGELALLVARQAVDTPSQSQSLGASTTGSSQPNDTSRNDNSNSNNNNNNNNNQGSSSPLLFFVALGFGVVFTNLCVNTGQRIIVGVKYCFRYNARNRARMTNEDGEPITLETVHRPRRRREKKLMTMDEVNAKFPMKKYKTWVSERATEGLPTAGGVSVSPSRANSIRQADGILPEIATVKSRPSTDVYPANVSISAATDPNEHDEKVSKVVSGPTEEVSETTTHHTDGRPAAPLRQTSSEEEEDDDEHIDAALPPDCLATPGDTCAICIDTLEDDDDVRGLTCGHAFHAVCLDPWLTSRRACCPLCKADYYTPKPRPHQECDAHANSSSSTNLDPRSNSRLNLPGALRSAWFRSNAIPPRESTLPNARHARSRTRLDRFQSPQAGQSDASRNPTAPLNSTSGGMLSSIRSALRFTRPGNYTARTAPTTPATTEVVTPSQLESGTRTT